jgi:ankyrin repeat protein
MAAAKEGHASVCTLLIERGARVDHQEKHGMTALFAAAQEGHRDIATLLLEGGAQVNLQTNDEATALMAAARNGHASICTLLIERGARVNLQDNVSMHGYTNRWVSDCGFLMSGFKIKDPF